MSCGNNARNLFAILGHALGANPKNVVSDFPYFLRGQGKESNNPTFPRGLIKNHIGSLLVPLLSLSITSCRDHLVAKQRESWGLLTCSRGTVVPVDCSYYFTGIVIKEGTPNTLYSSSEGEFKWVVLVLAERKKDLCCLMQAIFITTENFIKFNMPQI